LPPLPLPLLPPLLLPLLPPLLLPLLPPLLLPLLPPLLLPPLPLPPPLPPLSLDLGVQPTISRPVNRTRVKLWRMGGSSKFQARDGRTGGNGRGVRR
jgi:hypothetical protein